MSNYTALLHDGTVIPIADGTYTLNLICNFETKEAFESTWGTMNSESLKTIEIQRGEITVGTFYNCVLTNIQIVINSNNTYTVHFYLKENDTDEELPKTYTQLLAERIDALEDGQATQDGAIEDLGYAISELAEGGEA